MHDEKNAIEVSNVCKSFRVCNGKKNQLKDKFLLKDRTKVEVHEVLKEISFSVKKGTAVALIGRNGCGKSTTLKLLTRILTPNSGKIELTGRVASLIELGAGFHPDMTGRENVYINASIFGIKRREVDELLDGIIRFSELEDYIDQPVRTYSSGMYMRLAFSVAISVRADILLIDEILAVGDTAFQTKCFNKLKELKKNGTTIIIVSHSMGQIRQICDRAIWIEDGKIVKDGKVAYICKQYVEFMDEFRSNRLKKEKIERKEMDVTDNLYATFSQAGSSLKREGTKEAYFLGATLWNAQQEKTNKFESNDQMIFKLKYTTGSEKVYGSILVDILREDGVYVYGSSTALEGGELICLNDSTEVTFVIRNNNFFETSYNVDIKILGPEGEVFDFVKDVIEFRVANLEIHERGMISMIHEWTRDGVVLEKEHNEYR